MGHSKLSPSGFKANELCAARYRLTHHLPQRETEDAELGTAAHELLELLVKKQILIGQVGDTYEARNGVTLNLDDIGYVIEVFEFVEARRKGLGRVYYATELHVDPGLTFEGESCSDGTADIVIIDAETKTLHVYDLKFGIGINVEVKENYQLILYALGTYLKFKNIFDIENIEIGIMQPRGFHFDGPYRFWTFPVSDLMDKWLPIFSRVPPRSLGEVQYDPTPGEEQCRWCAIKGTCEAATKMALEKSAGVKSICGTTLAEVKHNVLRNPEELSDEQLFTIYESIPYVRGWMKAVESYLANRALDHDALEGTKLVAGKGSRKWNLPDEDMKTLLSQVEGLSEDAYIKSDFKSVAQMEQSVKRLVSKEQWAEITTHIVKTQGKATLTLATDKRPAIASSANEVFAPQNIEFLD